MALRACPVPTSISTPFRTPTRSRLKAGMTKILGARKCSPGPCFSLETLLRGRRDACQAGVHGP